MKLRIEQQLTILSHFNVAVFTLAYAVQLLCSRSNLIANKLFILFTIALMVYMLSYNKYVFDLLFCRGLSMMKNKSKIQETKGIDVTQCLIKQYNTLKMVKYLDECTIAYAILFSLITIISLTNLNRNANINLFSLCCYKMGTPVFIISYIAYLLNYRCLSLEYKRINYSDNNWEEG